MACGSSRRRGGSSARGAGRWRRFRSVVTRTTMGDEAVEIYTDGACRGNPGPGGWGVILRYKGKEKELCGGEAATTNNPMGLVAVLPAPAAPKRRSPLPLHPHSLYLPQHPHHP